MKAVPATARNLLPAMAIFAIILLNGSAASRGEAGFPPFRLTNWDGREISLESLRGNRSIVVFTFARCVYGCPLITQYLKDLDTALGRPGDLRFVHVSVNPADDTPEEILNHFRKFEIDPAEDPRWLFLNGPADRIETMLTENGVEVRKRHLPEGDLIEHTIRVVVMDREGEVVERFDSYLWDKERMNDALR